MAYYTIAYPEEEDVDNRNAVDQQPVNVVTESTDSEPRITVDRPIYQGQSGSPLLDETGAVVGTAVFQVGLIPKGKARYVPMELDGVIELLINKLGPTGKIRELDERVRKRTMSCEEVITHLRRNIPANLDLITWAASMKDSAGAYQGMPDLLGAIVTVLMNRRLYGSVIELGDLAGSPKITEAKARKAGKTFTMETIVVLDPKVVDVGAITTDGTDLFFRCDEKGMQGICKISIKGGEVTRLYHSPWTATGACCAVGIALIGADLFWIDPNSGPRTDTQILRAPKSGRGTPTAIYTGALVGEPIVDGEGLTTDGRYLFTSDAVQGRIHRVDPLSGEVRRIKSRYGGGFDMEHSTGITMSDGTLFVVGEGRGVEAGVVASLPAAESGIITYLHTGAPFSCPREIAVGNQQVFVADPCAGNTIFKLPAKGGHPQAYVGGGKQGEASPFGQLRGLVFYKNALYVTDGHDPVVGKPVVKRINILD